MSIAIPPLPPFQPEWPDFQVWWQLAKTAIENANDDLSGLVSGLNDAVTDIQAILDPDTLTPDKKPVWMFMYSYLTGEQTDLDSKATSYGVTTEKTNYDNAISALTTYLGTLTTPVAWNVTSGNTTIVDATFRSKFTDVLTKKQILTNKMQATAKTLADSAASDAAAAQSDATAAQTTANTGVAAAIEYVADIPNVLIAADYTGSVSPSTQLPKTVNCIRLNNTTDVTSSSTWSRTVKSGGITCTINSSTGVLTITALTSNAVVEVSSVRTVSGQSKTVKKQFNVLLQKAQPPIEASSGGGSTGSGGTTATETTFLDITTATAAAKTGDMTVTVGSGGRVDLSASLGVTTSSSTPNGTYPVKGQWYWWDGASWTALGSEVTNDTSCTVSGLEVSDGSLSVSAAKTGLGVGSSEKFRFYARNSSGTRTMSLYGSASAVGS